MDRAAFKEWRRRKGFTQKELSRHLGVSHMAVAYWEWGERRIPALLPLALEALEHRLRKGGKDGLISGVPGVQAAE